MRRLANKTLELMQGAVSSFTLNNKFLLGDVAAILIAKLRADSCLSLKVVRTAAVRCSRHFRIWSRCTIFDEKYKRLVVYLIAY